MRIFLALLLAGFAFAEEKPDVWSTMFPAGVVDAQGNKVDLATLRSKEFVGIYFSARHCGPCKDFTPKLLKFRDENNKIFEIVFVSCDYARDSRAEYLQNNNFNCPMVEYRSKTDAALKKQFRLNYLPRLVVLNQKGVVVENEAQVELGRHPEKCLPMWRNPVRRETYGTVGAGPDESE